MNLRTRSGWKQIRFECSVYTFQTDAYQPTPKTHQRRHLLLPRPVSLDPAMSPKHWWNYAVFVEQFCFSFASQFLFLVKPFFGQKVDFFFLNNKATAVGFHVTMLVDLLSVLVCVGWSAQVTMHNSGSLAQPGVSATHGDTVHFKMLFLFYPHWLLEVSFWIVWTQVFRRELLY